MRRAPISRSDFERGAGTNLAKAGAFKPELRPIDVRGVPALAKDYSRCPLAVRETWGRFHIAREASVYRAIRGLPGVPRFFGRIDAYALLVERIEGRDASRPPPGGFPTGFFDRLAEVVAGLHSRGVVHGDLRQRRNVLVAADGRPFVVDFASGLRLPRGSTLLRILANRDRSGIAKLRARHAPETLSAEERRLLDLDRFRVLRRRRLARRIARKDARAGAGDADRA